MARERPKKPASQINLVRDQSFASPLIQKTRDTRPDQTMINVQKFHQLQVLHISTMEVELHVDELGHHKDLKTLSNAQTMRLQKKRRVERSMVCQSCTTR